MHANDVTFWGFLRSPVVTFGDCKQTEERTRTRTREMPGLAKFLTSLDDLFFSSFNEDLYVTDALPLKAARPDAIAKLKSFGASNLSYRQTKCRFV